MLPQTTTTNHYHNWGVYIYYHTIFFSNPTIFQFYHTFTTHVTTIFTKNHYHYLHRPPQRFLYLGETHTNVLRGLQRFLLHPIRPTLAENKSKNSFFLTPFWSPLKNWWPDLKVCGERSWLPILKMVWHFTICSVVWMLELSKVGCEDLATSENKF